MSLPVYYLRRWLAVIAVLFVATIAGMYFYARHRERDVLKEVPNKLGIEIKQTASGFEFSKSDGKRTLFRVQAGRVKEFKLDGSAELHNVSIILYGRDSSRFDQIYGDDFSYDKKTGNVIAHGEVQIDLEANPGGGSAPDQGPPKELKNPIHLKTHDLVFNQDSGDASTAARVDFRTPQATGWAVGVSYAAKSETLALASQVHVTIAGKEDTHLFATHGVFTKDPHAVVLDHPRLERRAGTVQAEQGTFFLGPDNRVERVLGQGNVVAATTQANAEQIRARADQGEMLLSGTQNRLNTATLTGDVQVERGGTQPMQANAGRAVLDFRGQNELQKIHAMDGVKLAQRGTAGASGNRAVGGPSSNSAQDFDITAPIMDFFIADGRRVDHAETSGAAQITISPAENPTAAESGQRTIITAGRFDAKFAKTTDGSSRLTSVHGAPDAKIVNVNPEIPDRVSTSQMLDAAFLREGGISSIVQQRNVVYTDNQPADKRTQAWSEKAVYTPADRILILTGNPRVSDGSMVTTATTIRMNRNTDDAFANGNVKSTYSELTEQPNGALLASGTPIHVTSESMTAHNSPAIATYTGNARLWQDANIVEAPTIEFDRDRRFLTATGNATQPVSTVLVQSKVDQAGAPVAASQQTRRPAEKKGDKTKKKSDQNPADSAITIAAARLTYSDEERKAHYDGGVNAKGANFTAAANEMDVFFVARSQSPNYQQVTGPSRLDHMVAEGNVVIVQPGRRAEGKKLVYTAADDKFVLTGGPPSIFDAERGKITGDSLTFYRTGDRVLVEGKASTPVVTQTRMAR
jgi:lipopolysaccharide export system protein LptA